MDVRGLNVTKIPDIFQYSWSCSNFIFDVKGSKIPLESIGSATGQFADSVDSGDVGDVVFSERANRPCQSLVIPADYIELLNNKDSINVYEMKKMWSKYSHSLNPYERIVNMSSRKISRAYFKLYEILCYFGVKELGIGGVGKMRTLHLCEAPGGFIQACNDFFGEVDWYAQTLYTEGEISIDSTLDARRWIRNGDGNMYRLYNMMELYNRVGRVDLVTGDGGFDVSCNHNNQEQMSLRLIFCEFVMSLMCLNRGGVFICKMFDSFTRPTAQMLCMMCKYFGRVYLFKPRSSRYMNGEKFIVCIDFLGISIDCLDNFKSVVDTWKDNEYCNDFGVSIRGMQKSFEHYNTFLARHQSWYINISLQLCKIDSVQYLKALQVPQNKKATLYCMSFGLIEKRNCSHKKKSPVAAAARAPARIYRCDECLEEFVFNGGVVDAEILRVP